MMSYVPQTYAPVQERRLHSRLGVASFILAVGFPWLVTLMFIVLNSLSKSKDSSSFYSFYSGAVVITWLVIAPIGHIVGVVLGSVGLFQKQRKRLFAVLGVILNLLIVTAGFLLALLLLKAASAFR